MATKRDVVRTFLDRKRERTSSRYSGDGLSASRIPASPSVTMRQTSSALTVLIAFASTTCPAKPAIDVAVSTAADGGTTEATSAHPVKSSTLCSPASPARLRVSVLRPAGSHATS